MKTQVAQALDEVLIKWRGERLFIVDDVGSVRHIYGPFASIDDALRANFFRKSADDLDRACTTSDTNVYRSVNEQRQFLQSGVMPYAFSEIEAMREDPASFNFRRVRFAPASSIRPHASWDRYSHGVQERLFNDTLPLANMFR